MMNALTDKLAQYAAYHRDHRNLWTHFVGIPMIVLAIATLLSRQVLGEWTLAALGLHGSVPITVAAGVSALLSLFYLRLDLRYGVVMAVLLGLACFAGEVLAQASLGLWLGAGVGLFVVGWVFQFLGHYFEGRKPAFVDDLIGLAIGPLFVVAEMGFLLGLRKDVEAAIAQKAGALH